MPTFIFEKLKKPFRFWNVCTRGNVNDPSNHYSWLWTHQITPTESIKNAETCLGHDLFGNLIIPNTFWGGEKDACRQVLDPSYQFLKTLNMESISFTKRRKWATWIFSIHLKESLPPAHPPHPIKKIHPPTHPIPSSSFSIKEINKLIFHFTTSKIKTLEMWTVKKRHSWSP